jgi:hypothetical protein
MLHSLSWFGAAQPSLEVMNPLLLKCDTSTRMLPAAHLPSIGTFTLFFFANSFASS